MLIACLNHDKLAVRELASRQLTDLAPQLAKEIDYDPAGNLGWCLAKAYNRS
jgi:hypothetical protein